MGKMIYLMGKSSSGKDTVYRHLLEWEEVCLKRVVPYTTRPIRAGEAEGEEYHFTDEEGFRELEVSGKIIESRVYNTYHGLWRYFTVDDGKIDLNHDNYLMIGTIEAYLKTAEYFGKEKIVPVLLELDDGIRPKRALEREMQEEKPRYQEMCRRFLADAEDFSEEKIKKANIVRKFVNDELNSCLGEIKKYIENEIVNVR